MYNDEDRADTHAQSSFLHDEPLEAKPVGYADQSGMLSGDARERHGHPLARLLATLLCGALAGFGATYWYQSSHAEAPYSAAGRVVTVQVAAAGTAAGVVAANETGIQSVVRAAAPSVVEVITESKVTNPYWGSYVESGAGSGVVLSADGYLITNNHVVEGTTGVTVRMPDGTEYDASVVGTDAQSDLAVLKIEAEGLVPVVFADSDLVEVGQLAVAIGNPLGTLGGTVTEGVISAKDRSINVDGDMMVLLQTSAAINPGNSGGGLFDAQGHLVGIVSAKSSGEDIEGLGFAIPSNLVRNTVSELIEHGYVTGRPALGIALRAITRWSDLVRYNLSEPGVYVVSALTTSPLELWDRVLTVRGMTVGSSDDVKAAIAGCAVGDTVQVEIVRGRQSMTLDVTLEEQTPEMIDNSLV